MSEFTAISQKLANLNRFANKVNADTARMNLQRAHPPRSNQIGPRCWAGHLVEGPYIVQCRSKRCRCICHDGVEA